MTINKETRKRIVRQIIIIASVSLVVSAVILFIYIELSNNRALISGIIKIDSRC